MTTRRVLFVALAALAGCSSAGTTPGSTGAAAAPNALRRGNSNLISEGEIQQLGGAVESAFELVERLRPTMMRSRASTFGASQTGESINVVAYVDEVRLGEVTTLRSVPATQVKEIRYHSATDATQRWGTGHGSGAIQVITKK